MEGVSYELLTLEPGETRHCGAHVAGYFYHVLEGQVALWASGDTSFTAGERDTLLVSGFTEHWIRNESESTVRMLNGAEPHEYLAWMAPSMATSCLRAADEHPLMKRLLLTMDIVVEEIGNPAFLPDQLTLERTAELILFYCIRMGSAEPGRLDPYPWNDGRLMAAVQAMTDSPETRWTVSSLAERANMSRSAFAARFRAQMGESPIHMLTRIRLKSAADRLLRGQSMQEAALASGYGSQEAFNRAFKRAFGVTPGRWMRSRTP